MTKDYSKGNIYSIRSRSRPDLVYVGSTIQPLSERLGGHRRERKKCCSRQIIELGDAYIELIENYPCSNVEELRRREGQFQRSIDCVNQLIAGRTRAEWDEDQGGHRHKFNKIYWSKNKEALSIQSRKYREEINEQILSWNKKYRLDNKEDIKRRRVAKNEKQTCICGTIYNYGYTSDRNKH